LAWAHSRLATCFRLLTVVWTEVDEYLSSVPLHSVVCGAKINSWLMMKRFR